MSVDRPEPGVRRHECPRVVDYGHPSRRRRRVALDARHREGLGLGTLAGLAAKLRGMGLLVSNLIEPGARIDPATRDRLAAQLQGEAAGRLAIAEATPPLRDVLVNIVPRNPVQAAADFELLPLIVFTVILGAAVSLLTAERKRSVVTFFEGVNDASGTVIGWVMRLAPYAVFALLGAVVARFGLDVLRSLLIYAVTVLDLVVERDSPRDHGDRRTTPRHLPRGEQLRAAARRHDQRPARHS